MLDDHAILQVVTLSDLESQLIDAYVQTISFAISYGANCEYGPTKDPNEIPEHSIKSIKVGLHVQLIDKEHELHVTEIPLGLYPHIVGHA